MYKHIQKYQKNIADIYRNHPRRYLVIGVVLFWVACIAGLLWQRDVIFRYDTDTCFYQPTLMPQLLQSSGDKFRLKADQAIRIGDVVVFAARMCVVPVAPPTHGLSKTQLSVKGLPLSKSYVVHVADPPKVINKLSDKPIPLSKNINLKLSKMDIVHNYKLVAGGRVVDCIVTVLELSCDIRKLQLEQGRDYEIRIEQYFAGKQSAVMLAQQVHTLEATTIVDSSIGASETVYAKPRELILTTDKEVAAASVRLYKLNGASREAIETSVTPKEKTIVISWQDDLSRQAAYELAATSVTAKDGSGLNSPYTLGFRTSGGPKVVSISIGSYKVPLGASATLTFDQPIADSQDVSQVITATGGARITGKSGNKVTISFSNVPRCGDVVVRVSDALKSNYDISGGSGWSYATRTICQVQGSIGSSSKGRAITSYSFGGGQNTVLFTGAIHGSEASTRALMLRWVDELEANVRSIPADKTVVVVPAINPDGFAAGSRTNANNVDLNRNFATADWKSDITTTSNAPFPGGGGNAALSEPETQALASYVSRMRPRLVLSYHSIGGLLAANQAGDSLGRAATYASLSGYRNTTGSSDTFEYGISGTADDYYAEVLGVPSLLIELGSHTDPQFGRNQKAMWSMIK